ncbi:MAG: flagellar assembly protein FliW [Clostridiales bacterium]|jgi:flagellar assembly factor FliW|nr:flagellar assembly protein FliW [Bacillota bacterium]NLL73639.1 flagellar assembly protein FliW [Clostridiales bacterium]
MLINTRHFGEIELDDDKIIYFENGILGFENNKKYTILYDNEEGERPDITWLQSIDEPSLAIPIISPFLIMPDYNPTVEDELLKHIGDVTPDNLVVLVSLTIPSDIKKISANLKAPFVINADTKKGCQIIVEESKYEVKHLFYEQLQAIKAKKEGGVC